MMQNIQRMRQDGAGSIDAVRTSSSPLASLPHLQSGGPRERQIPQGDFAERIDSVLCGETEDRGGDSEDLRGGVVGQSAEHDRASGARDRE